MVLPLSCLAMDLIDLSVVLSKSLDRTAFLLIFIQSARLSGVRASITVVRIRKVYKMYRISFCYYI